MEIPPVHYTRTPSGIRIAYQVFGSGPPLVIAPSPPNNHRTLDWEIPILHDAWESCGQRRTVALFDVRGCGMSDRGHADFSLAAEAEDLHAVVQALGWERIELAAGDFGAPLALAYAGMHPERVARLYLWNGISHVGGVPAILGLLQIAEQDWDLFLRLGVRGLMGGEGSEAEHLIAMLRASVDRDDFVRGAISWAGRDARPWLSRITAPTLVIAAREHPMLGEAMARSIAAAIPRATVRLLPGASPFLRQPNGSLITNLMFDWADEREQDEADSLAPAPTATPALPLTSREVEVLRLIAQLHSNKAIAERLTLSVRTVERHITNLYLKSGAEDRAALVVFGHAHGYLPPD